MRGVFCGSRIFEGEMVIILRHFQGFHRRVKGASLRSYQESPRIDWQKTLATDTPEAYECLRGSGGRDLRPLYSP